MRSIQAAICCCSMAVAWVVSVATIGQAWEWPHDERLTSEVSGPAEFVADKALGYQLLTTKAYIPADFKSEDIREVWRVWPKELRKRAEAADDETRWQMIFERYGLTERVDFDSGLPDGSGKPQQYVVDDQGNWSMNCFACHGGTVLGKPYPGAPNNRFAFELFAKEIRNSKLLRGRMLSKFDIGATLMPLGRTRGTTNAVMFGVGLMHYRDEELNLVQGRLPPAFSHHDMDAPPWWHFEKKPKLYIDGFATKGHRGLMQFMMVKENSGATLKGWETDFRHIYAYLTSVASPSYPHSVDRELALRGAEVFGDNCAECHGTYQNQFDTSGANYYSNRRIAIDDIGTDPVRLGALKSEGRAKYGRSWFAEYGKQETDAEHDGYVAPPLDGVWASAPYFHNGSVPTLSALLNIASRPTVWKHELECDGKPDENFNAEEVGIRYETLDPAAYARDHDVFDTRDFGKSNQGHDYPSRLTEEQRLQVLEYLKTL